MAKAAERTINAKISALRSLFFDQNQIRIHFKINPYILAIFPDLETYSPPGTKWLCNDKNIILLSVLL